MPIIPSRLVYGELVDHVDWNNHADAIEEAQAASLISLWVVATLNAGWAVEETNNIQMQTRATSTTAFLRGIIYTTANKAANSVICSVPVNVRPSDTFPGVCDRDASGFLSRHRFDVKSNGNVTTIPAHAAGSYFIFSTSWPLG